MRNGLERTKSVLAEDDCYYDFTIKCVTKVYGGEPVIDAGCAVPNAHPAWSTDANTEVTGKR